jgi:hypothetical protein
MGFNDLVIGGNVAYAPTSGRWLPRQVVDVQGDNRPIYSPVRAYELRWQLVDYAEWANLQVFFNAVESSGSYVVQLPTFPTITGSSHGYTEYSGTTMSEPQVGPFFNEAPRQVVLIIGNITT